jgi:hypothetical protein
MSEHLEYRHFDVLQPVPNSDAKMLGSFIIGIPAMMFREFQNDYPDFELDPAILRSISPEERRKIDLHLWATMKPDTIFIVRASGPYPGDIPRGRSFVALLLSLGSDQKCGLCAGLYRRRSHRTR